MPWSAAAFTETAVVKGERGKACAGKNPGVGADNLLLDASERAREDYTRLRVHLVCMPELARQAHVFAAERDPLSLDLKLSHDMQARSLEAGPARRHFKVPSRREDAVALVIPDVLDESCVTRRALERLAAKWRVLLVYALLAGPQRHAELRRRLPGITQK